MAASDPYQYVHWAARVLGTAILGLFVFFMLGEGVFGREGLPPLRGQSLGMYAVLLGIVLAWRSEGAGAVVILLGAAAFYGLQFAGSGSWPGGWVFPLFWVVGALFLAAAALRLRSSVAAGGG